jgi:hypothetical protein
MWHGTEEPPVPTFSTQDRYYGTAVLMHTLQAKNRLLVFGGSMDPTWISNCEGALQPWHVHSAVREYQPGGSDPVRNGAWLGKASLAQARVFANAVALPTGQILIMGGSALDYHTNHYSSSTTSTTGEPCVAGSPPPLDPTPITRPELYDPGDVPSSLGSTLQLADSNLPTPPAVQRRTPRMFRSFALLLWDGRVLLGGGERNPNTSGVAYPESRFTGEIYYPPYFDLMTATRPRPSITGAPGVVDFSTVATPLTLSVDVTVFHHRVDKVVLLRPGAVTHHFDADQRYVELSFEAPEYDPVPNDGTAITITVHSPDESIGPAGYWMLFVVEDSDETNPPNRDDLVPSTAHFIRFKRRP